jgi:aminoglycoside 6'-N-acetyltransferase
MRFTFEPVTHADFAQLSRWRGEPHVERWWPGPHDLGSIETEYRPLVDGSDATKAFICRLDDRPIGYVQSYRLADEPAWRATIGAAIGEDAAVGIDYFIGEADLIGRGVGSTMIEAFVAIVWRVYDDVPSVVVAVQQENAASWRALERAGFARVWQGRLDTDDPSDQGPAYLYRMDRIES